VSRRHAGRTSLQRGTERRRFGGGPLGRVPITQQRSRAALECGRGPTPRPSWRELEDVAGRRLVRAVTTWTPLAHVTGLHLHSLRPGCCRCPTLSALRPLLLARGCHLSALRGHARPTTLIHVIFSSTIPRWCPWSLRLISNFRAGGWQMSSSQMSCTCAVPKRAAGSRGRARIGIGSGTQMADEMERIMAALLFLLPDYPAGPDTSRPRVITAAVVLQGAGDWRLRQILWADAERHRFQIERRHGRIRQSSSTGHGNLTLRRSCRPEPGSR